MTYRDSTSPQENAPLKLQTRTGKRVKKSCTGTTSPLHSVPSKRLYQLALLVRGLLLTITCLQAGSLAFGAVLASIFYLCYLSYLYDMPHLVSVSIIVSGNSTSITSAAQVPVPLPRSTCYLTKTSLTFPSCAVGCIGRQTTPESGGREHAIPHSQWWS